MVRIHKVVASINIAVMLYAKTITAGLGQCAKSAFEPAGLGKSHIEKLNEHPSDIFLYPQVENRAHKIPVAPGRNVPGRSLKRRVRPADKIHRRKKLKITASQLFSKVLINLSSAMFAA